jgi:hypothetical protein
LTLRFDPRRFPLKPAACYRASWQLPGPDLPRQATTSLSLNHDVLLIDLQPSGRTPDRRGISRECPRICVGMNERDAHAYDLDK